MLKYLIRSKSTVISAAPIQIFDLLQLSQKEKECRLACRFEMRRFCAWKRTKKPATVLFCPYREIEGVLLRRRVQDSVLLYRLVRRDRIRAFHNYMEKLPARNNNFSAAQ